MNNGNQIEVKSCSKCNLKFPATNEFFGNTRRKKSGAGEYYLHPQCKICQNRGKKVCDELRAHPSTPQPKDHCYNCGNEFGYKEDGKIDALLDHDYKTERFRGWLCRRCNAGIGQLGDDFAGLFQAIIYLTKAKLQWHHLFQKK